VIHDARFSELDNATLYALLKLRTEVFVVEQQCPYPELDGRDIEPGTRHVWIEDGEGAPLAYVRVLVDPAATRVGRVVTAKAHRRTGAAALLMRHALSTTTGPVVLDAQAYLRGWYERFGFVVSGPEYEEDGIVHVPMRLSR